MVSGSSLDPVVLVATVLVVVVGSVVDVGAA
jgi:hypothetical protein